MRTINYKVSYEKMISRLPALFAFLEIDEQGTCEIVSAIKGKQGNYGEIVANVIVDEPFDYTCTDSTHLLIKSGTEYTYRTIIETYYKAIADKEWPRTNGCYDDPFLAFVERGIGKKYVGLSQMPNDEKKCGVPQTDKFPLAPDYIYLGEAQTLLDKMVKMKKQVDFYEQHVETCVGDKKYYDQLRTEYELTNGDKLIAKLYELVQEAHEVATEYLKYAKGTNLTLDFNVNLVNTIKDLGMVTPYIQEWVEGKRYYKGDVVYYVDENGYGMTWECVFENEGLDGIVKTDDYGRYYTEGEYNTETEVITFDNGYDETTKKRNWKPQSLNWVNRNKRWICPKCGKVYETNTTLCKCGYDGKFTCSKYVSNMSDTISVNGQCNSHLASLRRFETYMNSREEAEYTDQYTDWLWYYRKNRIMNREAKYDEMGNIGVMYDEDNGDNDALYGKGIEAIVNEDKTIGSNLKITDGYIINLAAWGDAITNIIAENNEESGQGTITFEYMLGAHLKATKGQLIQVSKEFTLNGTSYKKGYEIPYKIYEENNLSDKVIFKVVKSFTYGGKKYEIDEKINLATFEEIIKSDTKYTNYISIFAKESFIISDGSGKKERTFEEGEYVDISTYNSIPSEYKDNFTISDSEWYSIDDDGNYKYYFSNFEVDTDSVYGKNMGVKYTDTYIYYKGDMSRVVTENITENDDVKYYEGSTLTEDEYNKLSDDDKKKCKRSEESVWSLVEDGIFDKYINGEYDKDYIPTGVDEDESYYKLYDKMIFYYDVHSYKIRIGNKIKEVPYILTNFTTNVDITHVDIEERPLIRYDYYNGVSFQPSTNTDDVYIERGVTQAFEKHIKLGEIKTFEDFENYANGGFFQISKEDIDLG